MRKSSEITSEEKFEKPILVTPDVALEALLGHKATTAAIIVAAPYAVRTMRMLFSRFDGPIIPVGGTVTGMRFGVLIVVGKIDDLQWRRLAIEPRMLPGCYVGELVGAPAA